MANDETTTLEARPREQVYAHFVGRCWSDPAFKQRFMADARAVIAEEGLELPGDLTIEVIEEGRGQMHLVLPPPTQMPQDGLSDEAAVELARDYNFTGPAVAIVAKALQKADFRERLAVAPREAIGQQFGQEPPADLEIRVLNDDATTSHFVLPLPPTTDGELDEAELGAIAGGSNDNRQVVKWSYLRPDRVASRAGTMYWEEIKGVKDLPKRMISDVKSIFGGW